LSNYDAEQQFYNCLHCGLEYEILAELSYQEIKYCPFCGEDLGFNVTLDSDDESEEEDSVIWP
jgi:transcription initiation factor IIE alpha subunit